MNRITKTNQLRSLAWRSVILTGLFLVLGVEAKDQTTYLVRADSAVLAMPEFRELAAAYRGKSVKAKNAYFQNWKQYSDSLYALPLAATGVEPRIYSLFEEVFHPDTMGIADILQNMTLDLGGNKAGRIGVEGMRSARYKYEGFARDAKYVVVQNSVKYSLCDSSELLHTAVSRSCVDSGMLEGFHPRVDFFDKPVLVVSKAYEIGVSMFLLDKSIQIGPTLSRMDIEELYRRKEFLRPDLEIYGSDKKMGWRLHTFPVLHLVNFDKQLNRAGVILSRSPDQIDCARYRFEAGKWVSEGRCVLAD